MHIIDKNLFKTQIAPKDLLEDDVIPSIPYSSVLEKKIKKRYIYALKNKSPALLAQRNLIEVLLRRIDLNDSAVGFRKGACYLNFLEPHSNNYHFLRFDIKNFFHSIDEKLLRDCFSSYFKDECIDPKNKQKLISSFLNLILFHVGNSFGNDDDKGKRILPVGFPASPFVSNIFLRKIDIIIQRTCALYNITYTRYADDMLFSSSRADKYIHSDSFEHEIKVILSSHKLKVNEKKIVKAKHRISLNGYVIQSSSLTNRKNINDISGVFISNKKIIKLKKIIHEFNKKPVDYTKIMEGVFREKIKPDNFTFPITRAFKQKFYKTQVRNKLCGYRAYLISFIKFNLRYDCIPGEKIESYSKLIDEIDAIIK
ncbi:reverse transcriptase family protein [Klebsiella variicola]|uniref:reverse transcriptase family protein n=1 Tax=Klebsiella variicola TaxID=244366 RepID=UPI002C486DC3|nr:RNA-directed DNA polymerase [Klebsiella variicola]